MSKKKTKHPEIHPSFPSQASAQPAFMGSQSSLPPDASAMPSVGEQYGQ